MEKQSEDTKPASLQLDDISSPRRHEEPEERALSDTETTETATEMTETQGRPTITRGAQQEEGLATDALIAPVQQTMEDNWGGLVK